MKTDSTTIYPRFIKFYRGYDVWEVAKDRFKVTDEYLKASIQQQPFHSVTNCIAAIDGVLDA